MRSGHHVGAGYLASGDIEQGINMPVIRQDCLDNPLKGSDIHHVAGKATGTAADLAKRLQDRSDLLLAVDQGHDVSAFRGEMTGQGTSQHTGGAADHGDLSLYRKQFIHSSVSV